MFYKLLIQKLIQPPVSNEYWKEKLNVEETIKLENRWIVLYELHKPPNIVELDFKLFTMLYLHMNFFFNWQN